jgi:ADP-heptose:LPS heptosyltransferase/predicted O-methyltransferase YrrM
MNDNEVLPRISFIIIVLNGMPFIESAVRAVYDSAYEIIIVEGAVEKCLFMANPDGSSIDSTVEAIRSFPDADGKIRLVQGKWPEKLEMHNKALEHVTGDYIWLVDSDEVYKGGDITRVRAMLAQDPAITRVDFIPLNFWKGFDYIFGSDRFFEAPYHYRRVFKYVPGMRFTSHRPPTVDSEKGRVISGHETREKGIYPYHYSYVLLSQVCQKIELYNRYGWGKDWGVDLNEWYRELFLKWTPDNRKTLEALYPVWTGDRASRTEIFQGEHPEAIQELVLSLGERGASQVGHVSEKIARDIIGGVEQQKKVLRAWQHIQLDEPLIRRREIITDNLHKGETFWNIHVALAFLASTLRPEHYLEVGVRIGGSLVQVLHHGRPKSVVAIDLWEGHYANLPNTLRFTKRQFVEYQKSTGNTTDIRYIRDNSHSALKRLINEGLYYDLITVDGDHGLDGAWEDLEDAVRLLADRGAIVFDDIIHPGHRDLLSLVYRLKFKYPFLSTIINTSQDNGCAVFLKGMAPEELFTRAEYLSQKSVVVAGEEEPSGEANLTCISSQSDFACQIGGLFHEIAPRRIIETGTFQGEGTTKIIASWLRDNGVTDGLFYSIECSAENLTKARENLKGAGLGSHVTLIHGLSLPRHLLPSTELIREKFVDAIDEVGIFVDHEEGVRTNQYYAETNFRGIPDDRLGYCLDQVDNAPDFVLLDSGGHTGNLEFNYLLSRLASPCYIALDDINHIKHSRSYKQILKDPRFNILQASSEKFGYCIARFSPTLTENGGRPQRIIWIRTDSIGDCILSLSILPDMKKHYPNSWITAFCQEHLAELYKSSPFIDEVLTFDLQRAHRDQNYRLVLLSRIRELQADICLNTVFSRSELSDLFSIASGAPERFAFAGDLCNTPKLHLNQLITRLYTYVVDVGMASNELDRYGLLLQSLGITGKKPEPMLWLSDEDYDFADHIFSEHGLNSAMTLALFAGAQHENRVYKSYGKALQYINQKHDFVVVVLGDRHAGPANQQNLKDINCRFVDMTGKTTIKQAAAILSRCTIALGAETGLAHIASAIGTPHVILLGGGHFGRFMPSTVTTTVVSLPLECFGCNWQCSYGSYPCVSGVSPEVIAAALTRTLSNPGQGPRLILQGNSLWQPCINGPEWSLNGLFSLRDDVTIELYEGNGVFSSQPRQKSLEKPPQASNQQKDKNSNLLPSFDYEMYHALNHLSYTCNPFKRLWASYVLARADHLPLRELIPDNIRYAIKWLNRIWK